MLGNVGEVGPGELLERGGRELGAGRLEHLEELWGLASAEKSRGVLAHLGAGLDLQAEILDADLGRLLKEGLGLLGILVDPRLALLGQLGVADHVAEQGPRRTAEANQGDAARQLRPGQRNGLVDVVELLGDVDVLLEHLGVLAIRGGQQGFREVRALLVDHLDRHAQGLGDDEDVGEDDGGIDEAGEALNGLQGERRGHLGVPAALEEVALPLGLVVLGEIAASCTRVSDTHGREGGVLGSWRFSPWRITHMGGRSTFWPTRRCQFRGLGSVYQMDHECNMISREEQNTHPMRPG